MGLSAVIKNDMSEEESKMKIVQVVDRYKKSDGVGNVVTALDELLRKNHYDTAICSRLLEHEDISSDLFIGDTILFYHLALLMDPIVKYLDCKKVLVFHNITEPELLVGTEEEDRIRCSAGLYNAARTADYFDYAIAFSEYSRKCLIEMGWKKEDVFVLPIIVRLDKFSMPPSSAIIDKYKGRSVNVLFTGRVHPNKKQEDVIAAFAAYKELYHNDSKLFLVGKTSRGSYYSSLCAYVERLNLTRDVVFLGHVGFEEYLSYYHIADIYLCMSEHEGFCIPLVEAMYFQIPILAYGSTAIPDTLSGSGVLLDNKVPQNVAKIMNEIVTDKNYRQTVVDGQNARMEQLHPEILEKQYAEVLDGIVGSLREKRSIQPITDKDSNKYRFTILINLARQIEDLGKRCDRYVVYGAGSAGAKLYRELKREGLGDRLALCDSFMGGEYSSELGVAILSPEEAVELHGNDVFIISIQDKPAIVEIALFLVGKGIRKEQIALYDMAADLINGVGD
ncbi:MAG TPA: hypothetical protein DDY31_10110 [Lachnospiraceae bacterium]|nr:hypothetical protein [Lachnospiraceae bacterium]